MTTRVAVVTGTRAEFGLLRPVIHAIDRHPELELAVLCAGAHLLPPALTRTEVEAEFPVAALVPMQAEGACTRTDDARALGRGISGFAESFASMGPAWVVVLGDRIEALAAAAAAAVGGIAVAHLHGGDRAEGIADEAMRHAITKLAHLHLPATPASAQRIARMGEPAERIVVVGSPAIDRLAGIPPASDGMMLELGSPDTILLLHPTWGDPEREADLARAAGGALAGRRVLWLAPNHDPGRDGIERIRARAEPSIMTIDHLERDTFIGVLKRLAAAGGTGGIMVGNSSAGLIEAAALRLPAVDIGPRQGGRERPDNVVHTDGLTADAIAAAVRTAEAMDKAALGTHPYGEGRAGEHAAAAIASADPAALLRKRNTD